MSVSTFSVNERSSARYTVTLSDEDGVAVPSAQLTALTLWLRDIVSGTTINSRSAQDVLSAGTHGVTVHATSGLVTWQLAPADNSIIGAGDVEWHEAVFRATWDSGDKAATWAFRIKVSNLVPIAA